MCVKRTLKLASLCLMYNGVVLKRGKARLISSYVLSPGSSLCSSSLCFLPFQRQDGEDLVVKGVEEEVTTEAVSPVADPPIACLLGDVICGALPPKGAASKKHRFQSRRGAFFFIQGAKCTKKKKKLKMEYMFAGKKACVAPI